MVGFDSYETFGLFNCKFWFIVLLSRLAEMCTYLYDCMIIFCVCLKLDICGFEISLLLLTVLTFWTILYNRRLMFLRNKKFLLNSLMWNVWSFNIRTLQLTNNSMKFLVLFICCFFQYTQNILNQTWMKWRKLVIQKKVTEVLAKQDRRKLMSEVTHSNNWKKKT